MIELAECICQDDMEFYPYPLMGGYQCRMKVKTGIISVRFGGHRLLTSNTGPYEVWYPDRDVPDGDQTADDIWNYIKVL